MSDRKSQNLVQSCGSTASDAPEVPERHPDVEIVNPFGCGPTPIGLRDDHDESDVNAPPKRVPGNV